jgi:hypothetical protein
LKCYILHERAAINKYLPAFAFLCAFAPWREIFTGNSQTASLLKLFPPRRKGAKGQGRKEAKARRRKEIV